MRFRTTGACLAGVLALLAWTARADAQGGVHVCVGADQVLRYAGGTPCPAGQASYNLALEGGPPPPPNEDKTLANQINDLRKTVDFLRDRVSNLEKELGNREKNPSDDEHVIRAPFQVVDKGGNPIFTVTDAAYSQATTGRVHVGRGSADNYGIWVRDASGGAVAAIGQAKTGGGAVDVNGSDGTLRVELSGQGGVRLKNAAGQDVVSFGLKAANTAKGVFQLVGLFQLFNEAGGPTLVEAGTSPKGVGVVKVGPGGTCVPIGPLRVPDCIMGRQQP